MCVHDSGALLTEPGGARNRGARRGWERRGAGVREERRGKVSEDGAFRWRRVRDWGSGSRGGVLRIVSATPRVLVMERSRQIRV